MYRSIFFLLTLLIFSAAVKASDCVISYRYIDDLKANYYDVYADKIGLELKENDYGCVSPLCALRKAQKLEEEGQCEIIPVACQYRYSNKYIQKGTTIFYRNKALMAGMEGKKIRSDEVQETIKDFLEAGYCSSVKEIYP